MAKTIELYTYDVEKGRVVNEKSKTLREVYDELNQALKEEGLIQDLDYFHCHDDNGDTLVPHDDIRWIACYPVTGDSEGHYIHVDFIMNSTKHSPTGRAMPFLAKTFEGFEHACKVANKLAELLGA